MVAAFVIALVMITAVVVSSVNSGRYWPLDGMILRAGDLGDDWSDQEIDIDSSEKIGQMEDMTSHLASNGTPDEPVRLVLTVTLLRFSSPEEAELAYNGLASALVGSFVPWDQPYEGKMVETGNGTDKVVNAVFHKREFVCALSLTIDGLSHSDCVCDMSKLMDKQNAKIQ